MMDNKTLLKKHNKLIFILDICVFLILAMSFGSLIITNAMVSKNNDVVYKEANPVTASIHNLEQHPRWFDGIKIYLIHSGFLGLLFSHYVWIRNTAKETKHLKWMTYAYGLVTMIIAYDFFNNLGYLIGGII